MKKTIPKKIKISRHERGMLIHSQARKDRMRRQKENERRIHYYK